MFGKVGGEWPKHSVFRFLKGKLGGVMGTSLKWNFTKFLCDKNGISVRRHGPPTAPSSLVKDIEALLKAWTRIRCAPQLFLSSLVSLYDEPHLRKFLVLCMYSTLEW
jgi:hypothetical protein